MDKKEFKKIETEQEVNSNLILWGKIKDVDMPLILLIPVFKEEQPGVFSSYPYKFEPVTCFDKVYFKEFFENKDVRFEYLDLYSIELVKPFVTKNKLMTINYSIVYKNNLYYVDFDGLYLPSGMCNEISAKDFATVIGLAKNALDVEFTDTPIPIYFKPPTFEEVRNRFACAEKGTPERTLFDEGYVYFASVEITGLFHY